MPNWKTPGPDGVQGYWLKNFKCVHESLQLDLIECLESATVPDWMANGRTVLKHDMTCQRHRWMAFATHMVVFAQNSGFIFQNIFSK